MFPAPDESVSEAHFVPDSIHVFNSRVTRGQSTSSGFRCLLGNLTKLLGMCRERTLVHCNLLKSTLNVKICIIIILLKFTVVIGGGILPISLSFLFNVITGM